MDEVINENTRFRLMAVNTFAIFLRAASLNPISLKNKLIYVRITMKRPVYSSHIFDYILAAIISILLMVKFICGYLTLAASIIAVFPLVTDHLPKLLLPYLVANVLENILLPSVECFVGLLLYRNFNGRLIVFCIFLLSVAIKFFFAINILNDLLDLYQQLATMILLNTSDSSLSLSDEYELEDILEDIQFLSTG